MSKELEEQFCKEKGYSNFNPTIKNEYSYWLQSEIEALTKEKLEAERGVVCFAKSLDKERDKTDKLTKENEELRDINKMPLTLTAENGAKSLLIGEFYESIEVNDEDGNPIGIETVVQWTTIKDIYEKIVKHYTKTK